MSNEKPKVEPIIRMSTRPQAVNKRTESLNHLLNFTLPPRSQPLLQNVPRRSRKPNNVYYNPEKFLNAQYRFVMNPTGDYTVHFADPDIFFQWEDILQILVPRSSAFASAGTAAEGITTCPICLSPPTAPRMTKCGHVYCFPCILHYLQLGDNTKWSRCPICFDSVNEKQLKCVRWVDLVETHPSAAAPQEDSNTTAGSNQEASYSSSNHQRMLHLRLMYRPQLTTLALPRSVTWPSSAVPPHQAPWHFAPDASTFARFVLATPDLIVKQLEEELVALEVERVMLASYDTQSSNSNVIGNKAATKLSSESLGVVFVRAAEDRVKLQVERARALDTEWLQAAVKRAERDITEAERLGARAQQAVLNAASNEDSPSTDPRDVRANTEGTTPGPTPVLANGKPRRRNVNPPSRDATPPTYHFYQSSTGQPVFLHPLDIRILLARFHTYDAFPLELNLPIESLDIGSVNDDLRRRCKYLSHLPEGGEVVFAQVNVRGVVGEEAWREGGWESLVERRRKEREGRHRKEERDRARAEEKEREKARVLGAYGPPGQRGGGAAGIGEDVPDPEFFAPVSVPVADVHLEAESSESQTPSQPPAWGPRSFASALHSAPSGALRRQAPAIREEDAWEVDMAWHDLEEQHARNAGAGGGAGGKKGRKKLVLMGGGQPGRRR
ncbi:alkylbase DNA N-glycosylase, putative [Rhizoctonia solani AG-3 Rhs1AP]|uniref:Alkylbase DNA N-glycosylase, putative n=2 Tax=Rhizoctonia solani AG-3 TaxID=1086053 RepID=X8J437_9AGAM|nr:alkylbase DNA N-glycosylase, putative [Rhizoctonia solani AG-3 Rhs1AP]KEP54660.1 putative alkylbase DNA N-glycosylase [Rhizoctonia solani 123E]